MLWLLTREAIQYKVRPGSDTSHRSLFLRFPVGFTKTDLYHALCGFGDIVAISINRCCVDGRVTFETEASALKVLSGGMVLNSNTRIQCFTDDFKCACPI